MKGVSSNHDFSLTFPCLIFIITTLFIHPRMSRDFGYTFKLHRHIRSNRTFSLQNSINCFFGLVRTHCKLFRIHFHLSEFLGNCFARMKDNLWNILVFFFCHNLCLIHCNDICILDNGKCYSLQNLEEFYSFSFFKDSNFSLSIFISSSKSLMACSMEK